METSSSKEKQTVPTNPRGFHEDNENDIHDDDDRISALYQSRRDAVDLVVSADGSGRGGGSDDDDNDENDTDDEIPIKPKVLSSREKYYRKLPLSDAGTATTMEQTRLSFQIERDRIMSEVHHVAAEVVDHSNDANNTANNVNVENLIDTLIERRFRSALGQQQQPPPPPSKEEGGGGESKLIAKPKDDQAPHDNGGGDCDHKDNVCNTTSSMTHGHSGPKTVAVSELTSLAANKTNEAGAAAKNSSSPGAFNVVPSGPSVPTRSRQQQRPSIIEFGDDDISELASLSGPSVSGLCAVPTATPVAVTSSVTDIASIERLVEEKLNAIIAELNPQHQQEAIVQVQRATSSGVPVIQQALVIGQDENDVALSSNQEMEQKAQEKKKIDFSNANKLYGRQEQVQYLQDIFEATVNSQNKQVLITVEGLSGVGKTKFVTTALQDGPVEDKDGIFITAKFEMNHNIDVPLDGMKMAMKDLFEKLLVMKDDCNVDIKDEDVSQLSCRTTPYSRIKKALQSELQQDELTFLIEMFPKLRELVQPHDYDDTSIGITQSKDVENVKANADRLKCTFRRFIEVVCNAAPLVLFCDDIQWADRLSLDLLLEVLTNKANPSLMVVASYRSNLVDEDHSVSKFLQDFETNDGPIHRIEIGELQLHDLNLFLNDVLLCDHSTNDSLTMELAKIIHQKTNGNIFFVMQLLLSLQDQGILKYNGSISQWEWENEEVQLNCPAAGNVIELVMKKVKSVDASWHVLPVAACLGSSFDLPLFKLTVQGFKELKNVRPSSSSSEFALDVFNLSEEEWIGQFERCVKEGFLESAGSSRSYKFIHDSVQEAALDLLKECQRSELQFNVGMILFRDADPEQLEDSIFIVAGLINSSIVGKELATTMFKDEEEHKRLVELFMRAGKRAMLCSAFVSATKYFAAADRLLRPFDRWGFDCQDLSIEILVSAVEAEFCVGSFDKMNEYIRQLLQKAAIVPSTTKARVCHAQMDAFIAQAKPEEAVRVAVEVLAQLGCNVPTSTLGIGVTVASGFIQFLTSKRMQDPETIAVLEVSTDPVDLAVMKTLDRTMMAAYLCNQGMWPALIFKGVKWTLKHGITAYSSESFACLAMMVTNVCQDFETGAAYGQHAVSLSKRANSKEVSPRTSFYYNGYTRHWTEPLKIVTPSFADACQNALICGDTQTAGYNAHAYTFSLLFMGTDLNVVDEKAQQYASQMESNGQDSTHLMTKFIWQTVRNLRGNNNGVKSTTALSGDIMDEGTELAKFRGSGDLMDAYPNGYRIFLACYFGEFEFGADLALKWGDTINKLLPGHHIVIQVRFAGAICCLAAAARQSGKRRRKYLREGKRLYKIVKVWSEKSPKAYNPNCIHQEVLLCAELAALNITKRNKKNINKAHKYYEFAESMAFKRGFIHDQALANERWSTFYYTQNNIEQANLKLQEAICLYSQWGAQRKVELLQQQQDSIIGTLNVV